MAHVMIIFGTVQHMLPRHHVLTVVHNKRIKQRWLQPLNHQIKITILSIKVNFMRHIVTVVKTRLALEGLGPWKLLSKHSLQERDRRCMGLKRSANFTNPGKQTLTRAPIQGHKGG